MSTNVSRVFVARLLGLDVFDPLGDRLGRLRDVVVLSRGTRGAPHVVGIVVEVPGKKRVFVPMTRITSIDQTQIICTGLVNLRRFEQRPYLRPALAHLLLQGPSHAWTCTGCRSLRRLSPVGRAPTQGSGRRVRLALELRVVE